MFIYVWWWWWAGVNFPEAKTQLSVSHPDNVPSAHLTLEYTLYFLPPVMQLTSHRVCPSLCLQCSEPALPMIFSRMNMHALLGKALKGLGNSLPFRSCHTQHQSPLATHECYFVPQ